MDVQKGVVHRLQEELQKEEEKMMSALGEKQSLSSHIRQLSQELKELRGKHRLTGSNHSVYPSAPCFIHPSFPLSKNAIQSNKVCIFSFNSQIHMYSESNREEGEHGTKVLKPFF